MIRLNPFRVPSALPATPDHSSVRLNDPFAFKSAHARLAWCFRLSVMINIVLGLCVMTMVSLLGSLWPLKEVRIALLRTNPDDHRIYKVEPLEQGVRGFDLVMEMTAKRFVKLLLEVDQTTQKTRISEASVYMDKEYYNTWLERHFDRINDSLEDGLEREILIESANEIQHHADEWLYAIDFMQIDKVHDEETQSRALRAYVRLTTRASEVQISEMYENPLGIVILEMTVKSRGGSNV